MCANKMRKKFFENYLEEFTVYSSKRGIHNYDYEVLEN